MSQKSLEGRLERATAKVKLKLAEVKAEIETLEKKQTAGKLDEPGVGRVKAEIGRKLN